MKFLLLISSICALIITSQSAVAWGIYKDPEHPDKCVIDNLILSPGEEAQFPKINSAINAAQIPTGCGRMICYGNNIIGFFTCGVVGPPEGYKLGEPIFPLEPYPKCCKRTFLPII